MLHPASFRRWVEHGSDVRGRTSEGELAVARTSTSSNKNLINFTLKLAPSQLRYLESLEPALGVSSQQSVLREILEQFQSWFRLPVYQREALQKDMGSRKAHILQY